MISIERIDHDEEDYEVSVGYRQTVNNTLKNYQWFLVKYNYNNDIYVEKDDQWYYKMSVKNGHYLYLINLTKRIKFL